MILRNPVRTELEYLGCLLLSLFSGLFTYRDTPENILGQLIQQYKNEYEISIGFHPEFTKEETDVEKTIRQLARENNVHVKEFWTTSLYHPDDIPYNSPKA